MYHLRPGHGCVTSHPCAIAHQSTQPAGAEGAGEQGGAKAQAKPKRDPSTTHHSTVLTLHHTHTSWPTWPCRDWKAPEGFAWLLYPDMWLADPTLLSCNCGAAPSTVHRWLCDRLSASLDRCAGFGDDGVSRAVTQGRIVTFENLSPPRV